MLKMVIDANIQCASIWPKNEAIQSSKKKQIDDLRGEFHFKKFQCMSHSSQYKTKNDRFCSVYLVCIVSYPEIVFIQLNCLHRQCVYAKVTLKSCYDVYCYCCCVHNFKYTVHSAGMLVKQYAYSHKANSCRIHLRCSKKHRHNTDALQMFYVSVRVNI